MLKIVIKILNRLIIGKTTGEEREKALKGLAMIIEAASPDTIEIRRD